MYGCGRNPMLKSLKSILSKSKGMCLLAQIPGSRSTDDPIFSNDDL